jgi:hypothetical protein
LPQSDGHKDALKGFGLKHHILDKIVGQLSDVDATNTLGKFGLDLLNLILQRPQLPDASFQNLMGKKKLKLKSLATSDITIWMFLAAKHIKRWKSP